MPNQSKRPVRNRLALFRRRRSLGMKQVAALLGHSTIDQLSRFESGVNTPNLKTALKLAAIYDIPIRKMLDGYYEASLQEIRKENKAFEICDRDSDARAFGTESCSIEDKLAANDLSPAVLQSARRHSIDLVRLMNEKSGHFDDPDRDERKL